MGDPLYLYICICISVYLYLCLCICICVCVLPLCRHSFLATAMAAEVDTALWGWGSFRQGSPTPPRTSCPENSRQVKDIAVAFSFCHSSDSDCMGTLSEKQKRLLLHIVYILFHIWLQPNLAYLKDTHSKTYDF